MKLSEALQNFLNSFREEHNAPELLDRWHWGMETQVNVSAKGGTPIEDRPHTYTNGDYEWWNIRVPKQAMTDPVWKDYELRWPLTHHVEGIGMTGWDGMDRVSKFVGYDFDAITGHAKGVGITQTELERVRDKASQLDFVETRRSTSGTGLHLYVLIDDIPTANHNEHSALARAILGMMSDQAGFDFAAAIDCCGQNMWFWHRKLTAANSGFELIKPADRTLGLDDVPLNWKDHLDVVTRKRGRVRLEGVDDDHLDPFEQLTSSRPKTPLDDEHKKLIRDLNEVHGYSSIWVPDHHLCQTHTRGLQEFAEANQIRGAFQTISEGRDPGTPNCFMFPLPKGGWEVCRFHQGVPEAATWTQSKDGWTMCKFNVTPDLKTAALACNGKYDADRDEWVFDTAADSDKAAKMMGHVIPLPDSFTPRPATLWQTKSGTLGFMTEKQDRDEGMSAFILKKGKWHFSTLDKVDAVPTSVSGFDHLIRITQNPDRSIVDIEYHAKQDWVSGSLTNAKAALAGSRSDKQVKQIIAWAHNNPYTLVHLPFQPEYPGGRRINPNAPQHVYKPKEGGHPTWDSILRHHGQSLNEGLKPFGYDGYQWLLYWIKLVLFHPFHPAPYIFEYGPNESGKSSFHEAIKLLVTTGVVDCERALKGEFNAILENAILCYADELDFSEKQVAAAYGKMKKYVTAETINIRRMRTDEYEVPNTLKFVQTANDRSACPILPGDKRIAMIHVPAIPPSQFIPSKERLKQRLCDEASAFMYTLFHTEMPEKVNRLWLPIPDTEDKREAMANKLELHQLDFAEKLLARLKKKSPLTTPIKGVADELNARSLGRALSSDDGFQAYLKTIGIEFERIEPRKNDGYHYRWELKA